jgi:hypothetical protein
MSIGASCQRSPITSASTETSLSSVSVGNPLSSGKARALRLNARCTYCKTITLATAPRQRQYRLGPEAELVNNFLHDLRLKVAPGRELVVFREPRLSLGFPDVVIVVWNPARAAYWNETRSLLTASDLKVAHHLGSLGYADEPDLERVFSRTVHSNLARLKAANIVGNIDSVWWIHRLEQVFAAEEIIAIEAKVADWKEGLKQAFLNTWFASSSYLLLPELPRRVVVERACELGIGVRTPVEIAALPHRGAAPPASFASWLLNEWAWRAASRAT